MKRCCILGAVALAACLFSGCGRQPQNTTTLPPASTAPHTEVRIGVSVPAADQGRAAGIGWWAQRAMALYPNVEWVYSTAVSPEKQVRDIEDMMALNLDGLVILATESAPLTPVAKRAREHGLYVVNVDHGFLEPAVADVFIEGDNAAFGRKSAEFMVEKLGGKGKIVILRGIPCTFDTARYEAAMKVFQKNPEIEILGAQPGMWNRQKAFEVTQVFLTQHKRVDAIWAADDDMAIGCEQAIREAGRAAEMWILGGGGMKEIIKKVMDRDPLYPADITYPPSMIATGIHLAVAALRDGNAPRLSEFLPRHLIMDVDLVTPDNAQQFYFPESVY